MAVEYRTIQEVAGPLMLVKGVEGVKYNEMGEIILADGETRRCRVLEVDGPNVLVQLFEDSTGINLLKPEIASEKIRGKLDLPVPDIPCKIMSRLTAMPARKARMSLSV